jgi:hypothetical protein
LICGWGLICGLAVSSSIPHSYSAHKSYKSYAYRTRIIPIEYEFEYEYETKNYECDLKEAQMIETVLELDVYWS